MGRDGTQGGLAEVICMIAQQTLIATLHSKAGMG